MLNGRFVLVSRPIGLPSPSDFRFVEVPVVAPKDAAVLVTNLVIGIEPSTRGFLDERPSYMRPAPLGGVVPTVVLGRVVESRNSGFRESDIARGFEGREP